MIVPSYRAVRASTSTSGARRVRAPRCALATARSANFSSQSYSSTLVPLASTILTWYLVGAVTNLSLTSAMHLSTRSLASSRFILGFQCLSKSERQNMPPYPCPPELTFIMLA